MIDLRSDTLALPNRPMLKSILSARLGDDGRVGPDGRGEDATVNELEDLAAGMTGKETALFFPTGTMGNMAALFTRCRAGDAVLVERLQHILVSEQYPFSPDGGRLKPVCYDLDETHQPAPEQIEALLTTSGAKMLCLENSHNFSGGYCIGVDRMARLRGVADLHQAWIHLDGARLFHAAAALGRSAADLCQEADSVMFCISKGLGAPIGSLLCGDRDFITESRQLRKLLGGGMRQAGVAAAPGLYALRHNVERLSEDNRNARLVHTLLLGQLKHISIQAEVQSNLLLLDVSGAPVTAEAFCELARERGLLLMPMEERNCVRLVFHLGNTENDALRAAEIITAIDNAL